MPQKSGNIIHSELFDNRLVEIVDDRDYRSLYFAGDILQSRISLAAPHELRLFYTQYMMSSLLVQPEPSRVLLIGIGAGALVNFLHYHFPDCAIDAVDKLPQIAKIAVRFFHMPAKSPIAIHCCDGFEFLAARKNAAPYDLILLDAFDENGMSMTIYQAQFFQLCLASLTPGGALCCNLWSGDAKELDEVKNGIRRHAEGQLYLPVRNRGNIVALAFNTPVPWKKIYRPKDELKALSKRFHIDLLTIVEIARKHNLGLGQRMRFYFH